MTRQQTNPDRLALELCQRREAFGYDFRRSEYSEHWKRVAPWTKMSVVPSVSNLSLALLRDLAPYMPCHDHA